MASEKNDEFQQYVFGLPPQAYKKKPKNVKPTSKPQPHSTVIPVSHTFVKSEFSSQQELFITFRKVTEPFDVSDAMASVIFRLLSLAAYSRSIDQIKDDLYLLNNNEKPKKRVRLPRYIRAAVSLLPPESRRDADKLFTQLIEFYLRPHIYRVNGGQRIKIELQDNDLKYQLKKEYVDIRRNLIHFNSKSKGHSSFYDDEEEIMRFIQDVAKLLRAQLIFSSNLDILRDIVLLLAFGGAVYNAGRRGSLTITDDDVREAWGILEWISSYQTRQFHVGNERIHRILSALANAGKPMTIKELSEAAKVSRNHLYEVKKTLLEKGLIWNTYTDRSQRYDLTTTGKNYVLYKSKNMLRTGDIASENSKMYSPKFDFL